MYDQITVAGDWCRCSEGHDLRGVLLQTKDLGCTMGDWVLDEELRGEPGRHGDIVDMPFSGTLSAYTDCQECPAFVATVTWNVLTAWVEFEIDLEAGRLIRVYRISEDSAAWTEMERAAGAIGPMSVTEAVEECKARREAER